MIDGHGDDLWRYGGRVRHNFSTNIFSAYDHSGLLSVILDSPEAVTNYPEPEPVSVEAAIAGSLGCNPDEVMVTNGATEAIYLIARLLSEKKSAILSPTFSEYQDACRMYGHAVEFIHNLDFIHSQYNSVWICNPNNPTGTVIPKGELHQCIEKFNGTIFVIDQAYSDYTSQQTLTAHDIVSSHNSIMLGSLTKRFAVPGLRIGYAIANRDIICELKKLRIPWSVNGIAIKGALYLLYNISNYPIYANLLHSEALRISDEFKKMEITVSPTDCNFILCKLPKGTSADLKRYLVEVSGILIRDASNFEGLDNTYFRVAAQTPEENNLLIENVRKWLAV